MLKKFFFCAGIIFLTSVGFAMAEQKVGNLSDDNSSDFNDVVFYVAWIQAGMPGMDMFTTFGSLIDQQALLLSPDVQGNISTFPSSTVGNDYVGDFNKDNSADFNDVVFFVAWIQAGMPGEDMFTTFGPLIDQQAALLSADVQGSIAVFPGTVMSSGGDTGTGTDTSTGTATEGLGCEVPASVEIATDKTVSFNPPYPGAKWQSSVSNLDLTDSVLSWDAAVATDSEATIKYSVFECNTSGGSFVATDSMTLTETTMSSADESKAYMVLSYQVVDTIETADEESGRCVEIATDDKRCYSDPEYYNN